MLYKLTDAEIRNLCKEKLESLEHWLRRLIHETLSARYGDGFFSCIDNKGNRIIKNEITKSLENRVQREPDRYRRKIDAVLLDDAVAIISNPHLFTLFRPALNDAFPEGAGEARTYLKRLIDPRNKLAHANSISLRQAEQVICYSNDVIDSLKTYYAAVGKAQEYNVPLILKVTDSFGNTFYRDELINVPQVELTNWLTNKPQFYLRPRDVLAVEVEVDPAFDSAEYQISWRSSPRLYTSRAVANGPRAVLTIENSHVTQNFVISCTVKSNKDWHRLGDSDDILSLHYKILPPMS